MFDDSNIRPDGRYPGKPRSSTLVGVHDAPPTGSNYRTELPDVTSLPSHTVPTGEFKPGDHLRKVVPQFTARLASESYSVIQGLDIYQRTNDPWHASYTEVV